MGVVEFSQKSKVFQSSFWVRSLRNKEPFQNYWSSTPHPSPNKSKLKSKIAQRPVCTDGTLFHCRTRMLKYTFNIDWLGGGLGNPVGLLFKWFFISQWPEEENFKESYEFLSFHNNAATLILKELTGLVAHACNAYFAHRLRSGC